MLSQQTIQELGQILLEDYDQKLSPKEITQIAQGLVGYYDLLARLHYINNKNNNDAPTEQDN